MKSIKNIIGVFGCWLLFRVVAEIGLMLNSIAPRMCPKGMVYPRLYMFCQDLQQRKGRR